MNNNNNSSNNNEEFQKEFQILKSKVISIRETEDNVDKLRAEGREIANRFVAKFSNNKEELGKIVTWLRDTYSRDEIIAILGNYAKKTSWQTNCLDVDKELIKGVKYRLEEGFRRPEHYSDLRVSNLVNILNVYDNYIDTFESIELESDSNCLDEDQYLISDELEKALINNRDIKMNRKIKKDDLGIYMVVFKWYKNDDPKVGNNLIYKYIKYPVIFKDCFFNYIIKESNSLVIHNDNSIGVDYLFAIDDTFLSNNVVKFSLHKAVKGFILEHFHGNSRGIYPRNIVDLFKVLLQGCPIFMNNDSICRFIDLAVKRKFFDIGLLMAQHYREDQKGIDKLREKLENPSLNNYNLLGRVVFIVEDLNSLIKNIKVILGNKVNQGPQAWRGQSDSLTHVIDAIDSDFRRSLNRHNQYHINMETIPRSKFIGRSKFSYQNIHVNLGNVRWYSTNKRKQTNLKKSKTLKLLKKQLPQINKNFLWIKKNISLSWIYKEFLKPFKLYKAHKSYTWVYWFKDFSIAYLLWSIISVICLSYIELVEQETFEFDFNNDNLSMITGTDFPIIIDDNLSIIDSIPPINDNNLSLITDINTSSVENITSLSDIDNNLSISVDNNLFLDNIINGITDTIFSIKSEFNKFIDLFVNERNSFRHINPNYDISLHKNFNSNASEYKDSSVSTTEKSTQTFSTREAMKDVYIKNMLEENEMLRDKVLILEHFMQAAIDNDNQFNNDIKKLANEVRDTINDFNSSSPNIRIRSMTNSPILRQSAISNSPVFMGASPLIQETIAESGLSIREGTPFTDSSISSDINDSTNRNRAVWVRSPYMLRGYPYRNR